MSIIPHTLYSTIYYMYMCIQMNVLTCTHKHTHMHLSCPVEPLPKKGHVFPQRGDQISHLTRALTGFLLSSKHLCWALSLSLGKVLSHTEQATLLVAPVFLASSNCCYSLIAALHLLLQSTLFWAAPYRSLSLIPKCFKSFRTTSLHLLLRPPLGLALRSQPCLTVSLSLQHSLI